MTLNLFFVPHTHWDREWYKSFEVFRVGFVKMLDKFLDFLEENPNYPPFTLDGQSQLIQDYLSIRPEKLNIMKDLIEKGRLVAGPWMVQPDLFQSKGEVIVRNLLMGMEMADLWGSSLKSFYIPESTGIISQAPQIMNNFNMEHLVFIRGLGDETPSTLFRLMGADGTEVLATYLLKAYNNAGFIPEDPDEAEKRIDEEVEKLADETPGNWILLNQGADHSSPQPFLPEIIRHLKDTGRYGEVEADSYDGYYEKIKNIQTGIPILEGELRNSRYYPILAGRPSARMNLKLENVRLQDHILAMAEPLAVMQHLEGREYPRLTFHRIWQLLLANQQHNTVSGTIVDQVCEEAMVRLNQIRDLLDEEWNESVTFISDKHDRGDHDREKTPVMVINTSPYRKSGIFMIKFLSPDNKINRIRITDGEGNAVLHQLMSTCVSEAPFPYPAKTMLLERDILIKADNIPGMGYKTYYISEEPGDMPEGDLLPSRTIQNEFYEVGFERDGSFFIRDIRSNYTYEGLNYFIDEADTGDLYNFSPLPGDITLSLITQDIQMEILTNGELQKTLHLRGNISLPESLSQDRKRRGTNRVLCPFSLQISLFKGIPYVDCTLELDNKARDHRLSVVFPTESDERSVYAGQPFDLVKRDIVPPSGNDWVEVPSSSHPFQGILDLQGIQSSLAVFSKGLSEYEIIPTSRGNGIRITLVRSVGWLSRKDCITRKFLAGPNVETPGGQCLEKLVFNYALAPHQGREDIDKLMKLYQNYINPLWGMVLSSDSVKHESEDLIRLSPDHLNVTVCKMSQDGKGIILRFYNPTDETVAAEINASDKFKGCRRTNMMEKCDEKFEPLPFKTEAAPREIVTIELNL